MLKAPYTPNSHLSLTTSNPKHKQIPTKLKVALKSNVLHLPSLNLDTILPQVRTLKLILDL